MRGEGAGESGVAMTAVAIVTGASSGIGAATAARLVGRGLRVYGVGRRAGQMPQGVIECLADVTDEHAVVALVERVLGEAGQIDILVNSAGYGLAGAIADTSMAEARAQFEVNFFGVIGLTRLVLPTMQRRGLGLVVNVSSLGGRFGLPFQGYYSASKFAMEGWSEALRHELGPMGIDVILVEPGDVVTAVTRNRVVAAAARTGAYRERFAAALATIQKEEAAGVSAESVGVVIEKAWLSRRRRIRYVCGPILQTMAVPARRLLPDRVFERIIARYYRAPKQPKTPRKP
jgi:short-subunit dehydrogenase